MSYYIEVTALYLSAMHFVLGYQVHSNRFGVTCNLVIRIKEGIKCRQKTESMAILWKPNAWKLFPSRYCLVITVSLFQLILHTKYTPRYNSLTCTFYIRSIPLCVPGKEPSSSLNLKTQNKSNKYTNYHCKLMGGYSKKIKFGQHDSTVGDLWSSSVTFI